MPQTVTASKNKPNQANQYDTIMNEHYLAATANIPAPVTARGRERRDPEVTGRPEQEGGEAANTPFYRVPS